jgi:hypothetical protein
LPESSNGRWCWIWCYQWGFFLVSSFFNEKPSRKLQVIPFRMLHILAAIASSLHHTVTSNTNLSCQSLSGSIRMSRSFCDGIAGEVGRRQKNQLAAALWSQQNVPQSIPASPHGVGPLPNSRRETPRLRPHNFLKMPGNDRSGSVVEGRPRRILT